MIKLKMKKEESCNSCAQGINKLLSSSEDVNNVWTFKDVADNYNKHRKGVNIQNKGNSLLFLSCTLMSIDYMLNYKGNVGYFCFILCLIVISGCYISFSLNNIIKNSIKENEHRLVDMKDVRKKIFYERYKKENSVLSIDEKVFQHLIDKLDKGNLSYKEFLELNLDREYKKIKKMNYIY
jgi:hypothetical protein